MTNDPDNQQLILDNAVVRAHRQAAFHHEQRAEARATDAGEIALLGTPSRKFCLV